MWIQTGFEYYYGWSTSFRRPTRIGRFQKNQGVKTLGRCENRYSWRVVFKIDATTNVVESLLVGIT
jgi:hypothetical protein